MIDEAPQLSQAAAHALVGGVLLVGGALLVPGAIALARRIVPVREELRVSWGLGHAVQILLLGLAVSFSLPLVWPLPDRGPDLIELFCRTGLIFLVPTLWIGILVRRIDPAGTDALGLRWSGSGRGMLVGAAAYICLLPALYGATLLWPMLIEVLGGRVREQAVMRSFVELMEFDPARLWLALVFGILIQPFFEELVFRGFLQPLLARSFGDLGGVIATSALFAGMHGTHFFGPLFALSLILGGVMLRTRRLSAAWTVHMLHNGAMIFILLRFPAVREFGESTAVATLLGP